MLLQLAEGKINKKKIEVRSKDAQTGELRILSVVMSVFRRNKSGATTDIIGTYVYTMGLGSGQFSYTAAIGLFVNVVNFILVLSTNKISAKMNGETVF